MRWELSTSKEESILKFLLYGGIPIVLYFLALFFNLKEVPVWDEYDVLLDFITKMEIESSSYDQFLLFIGKPLEQYTWYLLRLLSILEYILTGSISFSWQVYLGNSMLVFFYYALYKYALKHYHIVLTPIIGLIIFQYCYWEVSFWGLSAVHSFFSLVIIIIISIILMSNEGYSNVFWIIMLSLLCVLASMTNGILIVPVLIYLSLVKKDKKQFLVSMFIGFIVISIYVKLHLFNSMNGTEFQQLNFLFCIDFFLHLLSNSFLQDSFQLNRILGLIIFLLIGVIFYINTMEKSTPSLLFNTILIIALGSQLLITFGRSHFGIGSAFSSRYTIFSVLEIAVIAIMIYKWLGYINRKMATFVIGIFALTFNWFSFNYSRDRFNQWNENNSKIFVCLCEEDLDCVGKIHNGIPQRFSRIVKEATRLELYKFNNYEINE